VVQHGLRDLKPNSQPLQSGREGTPQVSSIRHWPCAK
jgi:hypothetical protein